MCRHHLIGLLVAVATRFHEFTWVHIAVISERGTCDVLLMLKVV